ncbi:phospholipase D family protein [Acetobacteraceae bacterium H6797]|nr:phospholipase D family protein [Acetobacteraceae bacterium H6797]
MSDTMPAPLLSKGPESPAIGTARMPAAAMAEVGLLRQGMEAFACRVMAAREAKQTLDLQYYSWRPDMTGSLLAREVLAAADRGVSVRILLDDMYALGRERVLAAMESHPRIAVRLFNSTRWRLFGRAGLMLEILFGGWHLNRRMHNKAWIADSRLAIVGGRNLGNEYFNAKSSEVTFRDLDLTLAGPPAGATRGIFEQYWHSALSRPAGKASATVAAPGALDRLRQELERLSAQPDAQRYMTEMERTARQETACNSRLHLPARDVRVVADPPAKARRRLIRRRRPGLNFVAPAIANAIRGAKRELLLISPYFVPGRAAIAMLEGLVRRGVQLAVVTNSLAATDVVAVHGGYSRYRRRLIRAGIRLYELKPSGDKAASILGSRGASLHTKAFMIDGERSFVGSFNFDPRSAGLNTEMGAFVECPEVARQIGEEFNRLASPEASWAVSLEGGKLTWRGQDENGQALTLNHEPDASLRRRVLAGLVRWLPLESQL